VLVENFLFFRCKYLIPYLRIPILNRPIFPTRVSNKATTTPLSTNPSVQQKNIRKEDSEAYTHPFASLYRIPVVMVLLLSLCPALSTPCFTFIIVEQALSGGSKGEPALVKGWTAVLLAGNRHKALHAE